MIAALAQQLPQAYQATKIEAMAAVWALKFCLEVGVDRAIVEGDSKIAVKALCGQLNFLVRNKSNK